MITVKEVNNNNFEVTVEDETTTTHMVQLSDAYHHKLTHDNISKEALIEKSFEYLLEQESNTMILKQFELQTIESFFPNYPADIKKRIKKQS